MVSSHRFAAYLGLLLAAVSISLAQDMFEYLNRAYRSVPGPLDGFPGLVDEKALQWAQYKDGNLLQQGSEVVDVAGKVVQETGYTVEKPVKEAQYVAEGAVQNTVEAANIGNPGPEFGMQGLVFNAIHHCKKFHKELYEYALREFSSLWTVFLESMG